MNTRVTEKDIVNSFEHVGRGEDESYDNTDYCLLGQILKRKFKGEPFWVTYTYGTVNGVDYLFTPRETARELSTAWCGAVTIDDLMKFKGTKLTIEEK